MVRVAIERRGEERRTHTSLTVAMSFAIHLEADRFLRFYRNAHDVASPISREPYHSKRRRRKGRVGASRGKEGIDVHIM